MISVDVGTWKDFTLGNHADLVAEVIADYGGEPGRSSVAFVVTRWKASEYPDWSGWPFGEIIYEYQSERFEKIRVYFFGHR